MNNSIFEAIALAAKCFLIGFNVIKHAQTPDEFDICRLNLKEEEPDAPKNI